MSKRDVWVRIGGKAFTADNIKQLDDSEPRPSAGNREREPLKIRGRIPYRDEGLT